MSRNNKSKYKPHAFECIGKRFKGIRGIEFSDVSANVYESMLQSEAFRNLKPRQKVLYFYCKLQFYGKRKPEKDYPDIDACSGDECFYFNFQRAVDYGLYTGTSSKNFYEDMKALEQAGLIKKVISGKITKTKNVYRFSADWKKEYFTKG